MTAGQLLLWIVVALLSEVAVALGLAVWRRRGMQVVPTAPAPASTDSAGAWPGWREFRVGERHLEDAAQSQCSFVLVPVDGRPLPPFKPGQFLTFSLDVTSEDGAPRSITRCYSLSDRPDPSRYRITVKRVPAPAEPPGVPPGLSSNHLHDHVREGDILKVKAPAGHFFIDPDTSVPAVLIGGGIGITPMMSMLGWCLQHQPSRTVHLYYGVRNGREHAFKATLETLARSHDRLHLHVAYSRPGADDQEGRDFHHRGHVDVELLRRTLPHGPHQFYVCGPPALMESLVPALAEWGVPRADLHFEAFGPASVRLPGDEVPAPDTSRFEVHFRRSGRTLTWDGADASLLEFAERHAIVVDSGCRSGGCGACETRLLDGAVAYAQRPDHDVAAGHCLLCVGRPASALVLEA